MKITDKIKKRSETFQQGGSQAQTKADKLRRKAVRAVLGGITSTEWCEYMKENADNPEQLQRLLGKDDSYQGEQSQLVLAYVASNAVCGMGTTTRTLTGMNAEMIESLDHNLPEDVRPLKVREASREATAA